MPMSETQPERTEPTESTEPTEPTERTHPTHPLPDLDEVRSRIDEAHAAEEHLVAVMPGAIQPEDDAYEGVTGPTEGDVEETDPSAETDDERDARTDRQPLAEQAQEDLTDTRDDAARAERS
jgi:hypothetical protein